VFFGAGGELAGRVAESIETGILHADVAERLEEIRMMPIAEDRGEQPHATMSKEHGRARSARREWHACTARLDDIVAEFKDFEEHDRRRYGREYADVRRVCQADPSKQHRPQRGLTMRACKQMVYRSAVTVPLFSIDVKATSPIPQRAVETMDYGAKTRTEYIQMALQHGKYYSLGPLGDFEFTVFQLIWQISPKLKFVPIAAHNESTLPYLRAGILKQLQWGRREGLPDTCDVFPE
jgi:hypothetical protein